MDYIKNKNYYIKEIDKKEGQSIIKKYHYSHKAIGYSSLYLGVFDINNDELCGCLSFGVCLNADATPPKMVEGSTRYDMYELNRMVMTDDSPKCSESQAIGLCIKYIKKYKTEIRYLLSFSDGKEENVGIIYQATNWEYYGYLTSSSFYELDGEIKHRTTVYSKYKRYKPDEKRTEPQILCDTFDNVSIIHSKQHVYIFPLKKNIHILREKKQYPKKETENKYIKKVILKENGIVYYPNNKIITY